jgi:hypothetical protein
MPAAIFVVFSSTAFLGTRRAVNSAFLGSVLVWLGIFFDDDILPQHTIGLVHYIH